MVVSLATVKERLDAGPELHHDPEYSAVIQRVGDLTNVGRGHVATEVGKLGRVEEIERLRPERDRPRGTDFPALRQCCIQVPNTARTKCVVRHLPRRSCAFLYWRTTMIPGIVRTYDTSVLDLDSEAQRGVGSPDGRTGLNGPGRSTTSDLEHRRLRNILTS